MTRASSRTRAAPHTTTSRIHSASGTIQVPSTSLNEERTCKRHVELLGELDAARVHDAGADAGQFEHLVVADAVHLARFGHDARIGGVDAVHVGVDFAADVAVRFLGRIVLHDGGQGDGGGVGAAAAERGDVAVLVDALEAGDDDDLALGQRLPHALRSRCS